MLNPSARLRAWLHEDLPKAKTPHERESIERTIAATDGKKTLRLASLTQGDPSGRIDALACSREAATDARGGRECHSEGLYPASQYARLWC
jgi:hypothetical protein